MKASLFLTLLAWTSLSPSALSNEINCQYKFNKQLLGSDKAKELNNILVKHMTAVTDWNSAYMASNDFDEYFSFVEEEIINAIESASQFRNTTIRSLLNNFGYLIELYGEQPVRSRIVSFLTEHQILFEVIGTATNSHVGEEVSETLAKSKYKYPSFSKPTQFTLSYFITFLRVDIIRTLSAETPYAEKPDRGIENIATGYTRSRVFTGALKTLPDDQIKPLRRQDHKVMGNPTSQ